MSFYDSNSWWGVVFSVIAEFQILGLLSFYMGCDG